MRTGLLTTVQNATRNGSNRETAFLKNDHAKLKTEDKTMTEEKMIEVKSKIYDALNDEQKAAETKYRGTATAEHPLNPLHDTNPD